MSHAVAHLRRTHMEEMMLQAASESLFVLAFFLPPLAVLLAAAMVLLRLNRPRHTASKLPRAA